MSDGRVLIYSIAGFCGGLYLFFKGFGWLKLKRLIENMPTSKVRSLAMGLVEVYGCAVQQEKILISPLLNKKCFYYDYKVQEQRGSGKNTRWVNLRQGTDMVPFYLKDDTGKVLVDPKGAKLDIKPDFEFNSSLGRDPPAVVKDFLKRNNLSFEGFLGINKTMRYIETLVEPNDKLYILGTAGDNPFVEDTTAQKGVEDIMIQKGKNEKIYYISDKSEKDIVGSLKWKSLGGIFGGALLSISCLIIILLYLLAG